MRRAPVVLALVLAAVLGPAQAAPTIYGVVGGYATAATWVIYGHGQALEGGAMEWTLVCGGCLVRIVFVETSSLTVVDKGEVESGAVRAIPPGTYELREFNGLFSHSESDDGRDVIVAGAARVVRVA